MRLFTFLEDVPYWSEWTDEEFPSLKILEARRFNKGVRIWIDEKNSFVVKTDVICLECTRRGNPTNRVFISWNTGSGWAVRGKCPRCGAETPTMYKGWKPEKSPMGGMQKRRFRKRRQVANY